MKRAYDGRRFVGRQREKLNRLNNQVSTEDLKIPSSNEEFDSLLQTNENIRRLHHSMEIAMYSKIEKVKDILKKYTKMENSKYISATARLIVSRLKCFLQKEKELEKFRMCGELDKRILKNINGIGSCDEESLLRELQKWITDEKKTWSSLKWQCFENYIYYCL